MLKIFDVSEAKRSLLRRENWLEGPVPQPLQAGMLRIFGEALAPEQAVRRILRDVRARGDGALREWTERIDGVALTELAVPEAEIKAALSALPSELVGALQLAAERIREFHSYQPLPDWSTEALGGRMGQRITPLKRVGIYVPGGTAPLPSSLLMSAIPAQVAGVEEIVVATPPGKEGKVPDVILAAAALIGVKRIYTLGGAQAIGALAYGTKTIPQVDKIAGPGNLFVTLAKREVYGTVGIDGLYGPTETMVIADDSANPAWVAADLLAQAEHDVLATAICLTPSRRLAEAIQREAGRQLESLSRSDVIATALKTRGGIVLTSDLAQAARLADDFAVEHLCLEVEDPAGLAQTINNGGCFFLGGRSFEVLGDYVAGPSHSLPTGGTARFASPLNVFDFVRINSFVALDEDSSAALCGPAALIADAEQLTAHAHAARVRLATSEPAGATDA